ncbi:hypothetical protein [Halalkalibacter sp. APA_J-10(15)]|uniref:hypothetical protein n=1 Tax=Halalkalibacter sp. APA_J-10(15) TaxID=2933805 RepID=UPI001FF55EAC|nr:hypothetical protein [Halalkalibacter sp. APA_J-10(15)]MCK0470185.1 hypothetical protein [Halalkalibacter sp. APA_J-10(15)]
MEINRKTFGGIVVVIAYLIWFRGGDNQWVILPTSLIFCIVGVLILKEKEQRWYENNWFKVYVSAFLFMCVFLVMEFIFQMKVSWFIPEEAIYSKPYTSFYTQILTYILCFYLWFVFTRCYFWGEGEQWISRWRSFLIMLMVFVVVNILLMNEYQYVDERSIHSNSVFHSNTTIEWEEIRYTFIDSNVRTMAGMYGRKERIFEWEFHFISDGDEITFAGMNFNRDDINGSALIMNELRERDVTIIGLMWQMPKNDWDYLYTILERVDEELAELYSETFFNHPGQ